MANRIFIFHSNKDNAHEAMALAADGTGLARETRDNKLWLREAMGLTLRSKPIHKLYKAHYPGGYELIDLLDASDADLERWPGFMDALNRNHEDALDT